MAKQTFTTGQVLTAAQMTSLQANDYNWTVSAQTGSYVLVAANAGQHVTMNAAGATTITVNTALFTAGDTLRITNIGAGTCTVTAGTATVTSAGPLALTQWASGILYFTSASASIFFPDAKTSGSYVRTGGGTLSGASTVFNSVFSATYDAYDIVLTNLVTSGTDVSVSMILGATVAGYYSSGMATPAGSSTIAYLGAANAASWEISVGRTNANGTRVTVYNPFLSKETQYESLRQTINTTGNLGRIQGFLNNTTSYTGFTISCSSGTFTSGTVNVYGLALA